jgi:hypothetical protein
MGTNMEHGGGGGGPCGDTRSAVISIYRSASSRGGNWISARDGGLG